METRAVRYGTKTVGWEIAALILAYTAIFIAAALFILMIYRASQLIGANMPGINPKLYTETHTYIVLIEVILWSIMARAAVRFKAYAREISHSKDGEALNYIANAILISVAYAILFDMASTFKTLFMTTPNLHVVTTVTNLLPLTLFVYLTVLLFIGTIKLKRVLPEGTGSKKRNYSIILIALAIFLLVVIPYGIHFYHFSSVMLDDDGLHHFVLSPGTLTFVYLLPFSFVWLLGLLSCVNLAEYSRRIRGEIYRPMFRNLYRGILIAYVSTYFIQIWYVSNLSSNRFGAGMYILLVLIALLIAGFVLLYRGANQLYRLER